MGGSWRVDETFVKVRGQLMYLYRAVDGQGHTVEFCLSRTRRLDKKCSDIFNNPPLDLSNPDFGAYRSWKPKVLEKAFFIVHTLAFLLAGLGAPMQNVLWFTDEDSIAANEKRVSELTQLLSWISCLYMPFMMGQVRCGTSKSDDGSRQIEDYLAIPDLVASYPQKVCK